MRIRDVTADQFVLSYTRNHNNTISSCKETVAYEVCVG